VGAVVLGTLTATYPASTAWSERYAAAGSLAGESLVSTVDSAVARDLAEERPVANQAARALLARSEGQVLTGDLLRAITSELSVDAATLYFARRLLREEANAELKTKTLRALEVLRQGRSGSVASLGAPPGTVIAFVPGFAWKADRSTGADLARQRALFTRFAVPSVLIETVEDGRVEENARIIANQVALLAQRYPRILLVSASKGGPETALALGAMPAAILATVQAWVSVGGLLRGSPYADRFSGGVPGLLARSVLAIKGLSGSVIADLSTFVQGSRMAGYTAPEGLRTVAWIATPLSGQVRDEVRGRWEALRPLGPNDGLTLLVDELIPGGRVLISPGLDHYYRDPEIDLKTAALASVLFAEIEAARRRVPAISASVRGSCAGQAECGPEPQTLRPRLQPAAGPPATR
jgi:hypothetical protein